ncbi:MAG: ferredoxin [Saprospiraceae bacterium]|nr:ferredoxin [Saprospiraceae bacterium]
MKTKKADSDIFQQFFREEEMHMLKLGQPVAAPENKSDSIAQISIRPDVTLPHAEPASEEKINAFWRNLRGFFRQGPTELTSQYRLDDGFIPATLAPFAHKNYTQEGYPFWMMEEGQEADFASSYSLATWLDICLKKCSAVVQDRQILASQLGRLSQIITQKISVVEEEVFKATPLICEALDDLRLALNIKGEEGIQFKQELEGFKKVLPTKGVLIPYSPKAPFQIFDQILEGRRKLYRKRLLEKIDPLISGLTDMINVEKLKSPEATSPEKLHDSLEFASDFVSFEKLSSIIPHDTEYHMPEERLERLQKIVQVLKGASELLLKKNALIILSQKYSKVSTLDWKKIFAAADISAASDGDTAKTVNGRFDQMILSCVLVIMAIRIAALELADKYVPAIHADYFAHLDWKAFSLEEWSYCTPVIFITEDELLYKELNTFSQMLASNRAITYLSVRSISSPDVTRNTIFRRELGALALAHRNTFVLQTSAISPEVLYHGIVTGLDDPTPSLFHLLDLSQDEVKAHVSYLRTSAAVEGREFPAFIFDNSHMEKWGSRFSITGNPAVEADWPLHEMEVLNQDGEKEILLLPFTYADFASLQAALRGHFLQVPAEYWNDDLILVTEYLLLSEEDAYAKIPFIWMVDKDQKLWKVALAWSIATLCRERLDFWHYLQENAGIHSYHVEKATQKLGEKLEEDRLREIEELQIKHRQELERIRVESARSSMEKLASMLLDLDSVSSIADSIGNVIAADTQEESKPEESTIKPDEKKPVEEPEIVQPRVASLEAYIDTALCTTCNECIDLNNRMFGYDSNKQAYIKDAAAGPYADLVKAAEVCPVHIIHPGSPLNASEKGLEKWIKRAEPFN